MTKLDMAAIVARKDALGNVKWVLVGDDEIDAISPSQKQWTVARTYDGLNRLGVVADFIVNAPEDIRTLLDRVQALEAALRDIQDHAVIASPETPFERGYNDGTYMARQIARRALED